MTRTLVMPVVTLQTPLQRLEAAEVAAWFDGASVVLGTAPAVWLDHPQRGVNVERWDDRLVYEWTRHWSDQEAGFGRLNRYRLERSEVIEVLEGRVPARLQEATDNFAAWWAGMTAKEGEHRKMTAGERARMRALTDQLNHEGKSWSNANREVDTKAKTRRRRNAAIEASSNAANERAKLL